MPQLAKNLRLCIISASLDIIRAPTRWKLEVHQGKEHLRLLAVVVFCVADQPFLHTRVHVDSVELANSLGYRLPWVAVRVRAAASSKVDSSCTGEVRRPEVATHESKVLQRLQIPSKSRDSESIGEVAVLVDDVAKVHAANCVGLSTGAREKKRTEADPVTVSLINPKDHKTVLPSNIWISIAVSSVLTKRYESLSEANNSRAQHPAPRTRSDPCTGLEEGTPL